MRSFYLIIFLAFNSIVASSQGINNLWLTGYPSMGNGASTIDFKYGFDSISASTRQMNFASTNANISDKNGNLLFYTNGYFIANALDDTLLNGNNLSQNIWTQGDSIFGVNNEQGALILPMPGDSNKYYLFHAPWSGLGQDDWFYSIIDMTMDGGLGAVISQNNVLIHDSLIRGKLTTCRHANGRDWWIIIPRYNSNFFFEFLLTPYTILGPYILSDGGAIRSIGVGQTCFSPDGKKYAYYDPYHDLDLYDFDRCSGQLSNLIHVDIYDSADIGGVAFSASSNVLYVSSNTFIYQFDLTSANIPSTQMTVAVWDTFYSPSPPFATTFYLAWLAPDNKIYIICGNSTQDIHCINSPDSFGLACDVQQHSVHLTAWNAFTIPQNVNYFLGVDTSSSICDSINSVQHVSSSNDLVETYPNPSNDFLFIRINNEVELFNISILNILGEKTEAKGNWLKQNRLYQLDMKGLSPGIYFLEFSSPSKRIVQKIIKD